MYAQYGLTNVNQEDAEKVLWLQRRLKLASRVSDAGDNNIYSGSYFETSDRTSDDLKINQLIKLNEQNNGQNCENSEHNHLSLS